MNAPNFSERKSIEQVEEGVELAPKFDEHGPIPVVMTDFTSGEVLMHAYMNAEAVADKLMPDFGELTRQMSLKAVPIAILSRQTAAIRTNVLSSTYPVSQRRFASARTRFSRQSSTALT